MERSRDYDDIAAALAETRPSPSPDFTAELDALVATGFQPAPHSRRNPLTALAARLRELSPQRLLFTTGGTALAAIAIATVVVASVDSRSTPTVIEGDRSPSRENRLLPETPALSSPTTKSSAAEGEAASAGTGEGAAGSSSGVQLEDVVPSSRDTNSNLDLLSRATHRDIERSAEIGLLAEPADVADDSAEVFSAVHDARGIVLHSTTTAGRNAGAHFDLLIPSAKLGDALAAFSAIDEVRTRHEATTDITAPTVGLEELLRDSRAKVDGLLSQLTATETESEREAIEIGLRHERHHAAVLRARLDKLRRRADYSRVSLRIESSASATNSTGSGWGIDDAFHDAGRILGIAAGITLIALAVIAPVALILLLAWLAHRLWLRTRRERALDA